MILNTEAVKALDKKDEKALATALEVDYPGAGNYLAAKILGTITDDNVIE